MAENHQESSALGKRSHGLLAELSTRLLELDFPVRTVQSEALTV